VGDCIFCGQPAGFLKRSHAECKKRHEQGEAEILTQVTKAGTSATDLRQLENSIKQVASSSYIDTQALQALIVQGWEKAVTLAFDDGILSEQEESSLSELRQHFSLSQDALNSHGAFARLVKGATLRDVLNGKMPERVQIQGNLPFNLQKAEQIAWVFQNVQYYEQKTRTRYVGGSQGVSIRIARGVYYRTGAFKGERVQTAETIHADTGILGLTNKHVYFTGAAKSFRVPYNKIVSFEPFSDGFGIQKDTQSSKPQSFQTGDGWFAYNLVTNLAHL
jgi:hypothetical protein